MTHIERIQELKQKVLTGCKINLDEARFMIELEDREEIDVLTKAAMEITEHFSQGKFDLCSLINAKSGMCTEDCGFCSQSVHFDTGVDTYALVDKETALKRAQLMKASGANSYCLVCSGDQLSDRDFDQICETLAYIREQVDIDLDCSIGFLDRSRAERLRQIGVRRVNHNLQSSRDFYPKIVSTHTYDDRLSTIRVLKAAGLEVCCGGIMGMGESREDRIKLALQLAEIEPAVVPSNFLNPRSGTPLENQKQIEPHELIKTVAVFRFILPHSILELAGGREVNLGAQQLDAIKAGANGLIIGGYLTTPSHDVERDRALVRNAGYDLEPSEIELDRVGKE